MVCHQRRHECFRATSSAKLFPKVMTKGIDKNIFWESPFSIFGNEAVAFGCADGYPVGSLVARTSQIYMHLLLHPSSSSYHLFS
ncbi:hypothetical protein DESC_460134 [Desulfosarcina cetonica]|nr:hypothetical protein DESC_460134 [Desulfosarcina cetonica]